MSLKAFCPMGFQSSGGRRLFYFLIAFLFFFLPSVATPASDTLSPPLKSETTNEEKRTANPPRYQKLETWDEVYHYLESLREVELAEAVPALRNLIVNLRTRTIKKGKYLSDADKEMDRVRGALVDLLGKEEVSEHYGLMQQLVAVMPNITPGAGELQSLWGAAEDLDERWLRNSISRALREEIHGHISKRTLDNVRAYLEFIKTGSRGKLSKVRLIATENDDRLRNEFVASGGDINKMSSWGKAAFPLVIEMEGLLSFIFEVSPSEMNTSVARMETFASFLDEGNFSDIREGIKALRLHRDREDHLKASSAAIDSSLNIRRHFWSASGSQRLDLLYLDRAIRAAAFVSLGSFYNRLEEQPGRYLREGIEITCRLAEAIRPNGYGSASIMEFIEILRNRDMTYAQIHDITKLFLSYYQEAIGDLHFSFREIVKLAATEDQAESEMANLLRDQIYLNLFGRYAEVLLDHSGSKKGLDRYEWIRGVGQRRPKADEILQISDVSGIKVTEETLTAMRDEYGGKGLVLFKLKRSGLPVPEGFVIPIVVLRTWQQGGVRPYVMRIREAMVILAQDYEKRTGQKGHFSSAENPILVSVRSSPVISMPGALDTIVNVGMNEKITEALANKTGDRWWAYDSYRQFLQTFAMTVFGMDFRIFHNMIEGKKHEAGVRYKEQLDGWTMQEIALEYKEAIEAQGHTIPEDPWIQLMMAIEAVFGSTHSPKARTHIEREEIWGYRDTAVIVQSMVFGNKSNLKNDPIGEVEILNGNIIKESVTANTSGELRVKPHKRWLLLEDVRSGAPLASYLLRGETQKIQVFDPARRNRSLDSGTAVFYLRDRRTRERKVNGEYKLFALGPDLVGGMTVPPPLDELAGSMPDLFRQLGLLGSRIEEIRGPEPQEIELTFQEGTPFTLQTRDAIHLIRDVPHFERDPGPLVAQGIGASGGAFEGRRIVFVDHQVLAVKSESAGIVYVMESATPEGLSRLKLDPQNALMTARGGRTSHAAITAGAHGMTAVVGLGEQLQFDRETGKVILNGYVLTEEERLFLDGSTGKIYLSEKPLTPETSL